MESSPISIGLQHAITQIWNLGRCRLESMSRSVSGFELHGWTCASECISAIYLHIARSEWAYPPLCMSAFTPTPSQHE